MKESGVWALAWKRFRRDRLGSFSLVVVLAYVALVLAVAAGWLARDWEREAGVSFAPPGFLGPDADTPQLAKRAEGAQALSDYGIPDPLGPDLAEIAKGLSGASPNETRSPTLVLGGDKWGRDVLKKAVKGTETSLFVGLAAAALATFLGTLFGALAGFRGGKVDDFFNWFYSVLTAIPYLLLVLAVAAVVNQKGVLTVILILGLTGWTGIFRLVRAEYMKHKVREYVMAADAIGASNSRRMFVHILPNVSHVVLVQLSLHVVLFIKSEVILTFLGFGVGVETVSWGSMLAEAGSELLLGKWWQLTTATVFMALLVTAFSLFTDAMRDALDPRLK
ncbi:MAG TPA: ABC transporter permease [Burkholderiales bacterium]|nr:ABC transporter permease [Burkholderiales bacterium]